MIRTIQKKFIGLGPRACVLTLHALACLFCGAGQALAQAPPLPQGPPPPQAPLLPADLAPDAFAVPAAAGQDVGAPILKIGFLVFDQLSYKVHPFSSLTGDAQFDQNISANGGTGSFGTPKTDGEEDFFNRALHTLPPFRLDYNWALPYTFPKGVGVGFDYTHVTQSDTEAVVGTLDLTGIGARLTMDTYLFSVPVRFYGFDPGQQGINYFAGFSLGFLNGNLLVGDITGAGVDQFISFSQSPVGMTRMGIEVMGENFGGRFELTMLNASEVEFESNPFAGGGGVTTVDMSGTMLQLTMVWIVK